MKTYGYPATVLACPRQERPLPLSSRGRNMIAPPADVAAEIAVTETFRNTGLTRVEKVVRRIPDPMHNTDPSTLAAAPNAMDTRLAVGVEAAH